MDSQPLRHGFDALSDTVQLEHAPGEFQVLPTGQVVVEERLVGHDSHSPAHHLAVSRRIEPGHPDVPRVGLGEPRQQPDQGRLAGAVRAEHGDRLSPLNGQMESAEDLVPAEGLGDSGRLHGMVGRAGAALVRGGLPALGRVWVLGVASHGQRATVV